MVVQGDARLEIRLRLAPELLALAERPQHAQQRRVLIVRGEPMLGLLDLPRGVGNPALAVEFDEFGDVANVVRLRVEQLDKSFTLPIWER